MSDCPKASRILPTLQSLTGSLCSCLLPIPNRPSSRTMPPDTEGESRALLTGSTHGHFQNTMHVFLHQSDPMIEPLAQWVVGQFHRLDDPAPESVRKPARLLPNFSQLFPYTAKSWLAIERNQSLTGKAFRLIYQERNSRVLDQAEPFC